jgi:hypothetical protein
MAVGPFMMRTTGPRTQVGLIVVARRGPAPAANRGATPSWAAARSRGSIGTMERELRDDQVPADRFELARLPRTHALARDLLA